LKSIFYLLLLLAVVSCQTESSKDTENEETQPAPTELPFNSLALNDLAGFEPVKANWSISGQVISDHTQEKHLMAEEGTGVLVNQPDDENKDNLFTNWEHGDLELKLEVMVPKGSNSGIYLQGRYEIQLLDSWLKDQPKYMDCGAIYQRWDESRPKGEQGYEGHPPRINAAKAPGLWQQFHIIFRAPRFDDAGNKIENARFEKVVHNGVLIHEMVEVTGPTRAAAFEDEAATGPLMIQGDHGPVALRNISYKRYFDQSLLALDNIEYQYFEIDGPLTELPEFDSLQPVKQGPTDSLVYKKLAEREQRIAFIFNGQLEVAREGDYLFTVYSDDGSKLFIEDELLIDNDGKHDYEPESGMIKLTQGTHDLKLTYFNNNWAEGLTVMYEGPEMKKQMLLSRGFEKKVEEPEPITVKPEDGPAMVRSFVVHNGQKFTHAISVGDPGGLHYSVDLRSGSLLQFWRGDFADVTDMWHRRGLPQLLRPMEMAVQPPVGLLAAVLEDENTPYPVELSPSLQFTSYDINEVDVPVFHYQVSDAVVSDQYKVTPENQEIVRTVSVENPVDNLFTRIASADYIQEVGNGYYNVGGDYYLRLVQTAAEPRIRQQENQQELLYPLTASSNEISYAILW